MTAAERSNGGNNGNALNKDLIGFAHNTDGTLVSNKKEKDEVAFRRRQNKVPLRHNNTVQPKKETQQSPSPFPTTELKQVHPTEMKFKRSPPSSSTAVVGVASNAPAMVVDMSKKRIKEAMKKN